jgi:hypothetical protein
MGDRFRFPFFTGTSPAFGGATRQVTFYAARVEINGQGYPAMIEPASEPERLIGRDVLSHCRVTFDGPAGQTIFD